MRRWLQTARSHRIMILTLDDLRCVAAWCADCAERALPLFERCAPADRRPREAIDAAREFARGGKRVARLRVVSLAALRAARDVNNPAAAAAARAACMAASSAYTHPLETVEQAKHILGPAVYAALACALNERADAGEKTPASAPKSVPARVREILLRFPPQPDGRTPLVQLYRQFDAKWRQQRPR